MHNELHQWQRTMCKVHSDNPLSVFLATLHQNNKCNYSHIGFVFEENLGREIALLLSVMPPFLESSVFYCFSSTLKWLEEQF